ncbi:MAG: hypothetical protein ACYDC5_09500, partial [Candidatus Dormibacteria bacterium]
NPLGRPVRWTPGFLLSAYRDFRRPSAGTFLSAHRDYDLSALTQRWQLPDGGRLGAVESSVTS